MTEYLAMEYVMGFTFFKSVVENVFFIFLNG